VDLDDPATTVLRRQILQEKRFLRRVYEEWYRSIADEVPLGDRPVLELGSGAGFLEQFVPGVITSDIFALPDLSLVLDAHQIPFRTDSLRAIVMVDVLHHLSDVRRFFQEAGRCVQSGGAVVMIEPWVSTWSTFVYQRLHHEPFEPDATWWEFPPRGPLSGANGALPWMVFERDRAIFAEEFPEWRIRTLRPDMPFCYLISGGMSWRSFAPSALFPLVRGIEGGLAQWMPRLAMFARIVLERT
jgi:SAM-dependent methyltransferase